MSKEIPSMADLRTERKSRIAGDIQLLAGLNTRVERLEHILEQRRTLENNLFGPLVNFNDAKRMVRVRDKVRRSIDRIGKRREEAVKQLYEIREHIGRHTLRDLNEAGKIIGLNEKDIYNLQERT